MSMKKVASQRALISGVSLIFLLFFVSVSSFAWELDEIRTAIKERKARWRAGETSISNLPPEQRRLRVRLIKPKDRDGESLLLASPPISGLPTSFDWRNYNTQNYVTSVRDQGNCGSCWAFATAGALESYTLIKDNSPGLSLNLAEQILVSCSGAGSCSGGYIDRASSFIRDAGLPQESCYPYTVTNGSCGNACPNWQSNSDWIGSWSYVATTSPALDAIKNALYTHGPLVTTMDVYTDFFSYRSGIYSYTWGNYEGGHAVLIVGFDDTDQHFIVKNSWGNGWGEGGFFNIAYTQISYPVEFGYWTIAYHQEVVCTYSISPTSQSFPAAGGTGTIKVTAGTNCTWTAVSNAAWITINSGATGIGKGSVQYNVAPNKTRSTRKGTITVAGKKVTVTQNRNR